MFQQHLHRTVRGDATAELQLRSAVEAHKLGKTES